MVGSSDNFKDGIRFAVKISTGLIIAIFLGTFTWPFTRQIFSYKALVDFTGAFYWLYSRPV
jgi:hypothetical protein